MYGLAVTVYASVYQCINIGILQYSGAIECQLLTIPVYGRTTECRAVVRYSSWAKYGVDDTVLFCVGLLCVVMCCLFSTE